MSGRLRAAPLDEPLYYLHNLSTVLQWVRQQHESLFVPAELGFFESFDNLSLSARALLARLVMRTHPEFRLDALHYPELEQSLTTCVTELAEQGWLELDPPLSVAVLGRLLRLKELQELVANAGWGVTFARSAKKSLWLDALQNGAGEVERPMSQWWPDPGSAPQVIRLNLERLAWFRRVRLMFFGNLRQDWSEFVIAELGHQRYVPVTFTAESRGFACREEVDDYLMLADLAQALIQGVSPREVLAAVPLSSSNVWLARRRSRLLLEIGLQAVRLKQDGLALQALEASQHAEAQLKALRLREKHDTPESVWQRVLCALEQEWPAGVRAALERIARRVAKKAGASWQAGPSVSLPERRLRLPRQPGVSVEQAAAQALAEPGSLCRYVENELFNSLLGLLCWPAIYAPLPGAFFHPFQAGPADLFRPDFVARRQGLLNECLSTLESGKYETLIRERWERYRGNRCPLINWYVLDEVLLDAALKSIQPEQLRHIFDYLLLDLRHHTRGMPDLICLWPQQQRFRLLEVKGPGDRLQDHQQAWLAYGLARNLPIEVCYVEWVDEVPGRSR